MFTQSRTPKGARDLWATTWECFHRGESLIGQTFIADVAASLDNRKVSIYFGKDNGLDALDIDWQKELLKQGIRNFSAPVWCNPPFSKKLAFIEKVKVEAEKGISTMMLLPYEPATQWWHNNVHGFADTIWVPDGRWKFNHPDGTCCDSPPFASAFILFTPMGLKRNLTVYINFKRKLKEEHHEKTERRSKKQRCSRSKEHGETISTIH